jgi:chemotaxis protein CheC
MSDPRELSEIQESALTEIGNIGAGNAATSLSVMVNKVVDVTVPTCIKAKFSEVPGMVGGEEIETAGILLGVEGDVHGRMMLLLSVDDSLALIRLLMNIERPNEDPLTELEQSALREVGNIITSSYLNSLAGFTNLKIIPTVPLLCIDMAGAILNYALMESALEGDDVLVIKTRFMVEGREINGLFLFLPSRASLDVVFQRLGI